MIAIVAVVVIAVVVGVLVTRDSSKPISEQSCTELVDTLHQIQADEAPSASTDSQAQATKDAATLNDRVDALGGCPGQSALQ